MSDYIIDRNFKPGHYYKRTYKTEPPCWVIFRMITLVGKYSMSVIVIKDEGFEYSTQGDMLLLADTSDWNTEEIDKKDLLWEVL